MTTANMPSQLKSCHHQDFVLSLLRSVNATSESSVKSLSTYSDVNELYLVSCNGTRFRVHRALLQNASPICRELLCLENGEDEVVIIFPDFDQNILRSLLSLIHLGHAQVGQDCLDRVTELAKLLGIKSTSAEDPLHPTSPRSMILDAPASDVSLDGQDDQKENDDTSALTVKLEDNLGKVKSPNPALTVKLEENLFTSAQEEEGMNKKGKKKRKKRVLMADLDPAELTCKVCGKEFQAIYKLKLHSLIHSNVHPFKCDYCDKGFNNKYKMRQHQKNYHKEGTSKFGPVDFERVKSGAALKPVRSCGFCSFSTSTKSALKEHVRSSHPESTIFSCETCGKTFKGKKGLVHHKSFVCNVPVKKLYTCTLCPASLSSPKELKRHVNMTHGPKEPWKCSQCPTVCSSKKALTNHAKVAHLSEGSAALTHKCPECDKAFLKSSLLEEHQNRYHRAIKAFACSLCPKRCSTKQDLDRHLASHQGKHVFQCPKCFKSFVHRATFKQHQRSHTGEKPYKCLPCGKAFSVVTVLKKHQKSHERKGDGTIIVKAPKGRKGCMSYIDFKNKSVKPTEAVQDGSNAMTEEAMMQQEQERPHHQRQEEAQDQMHQHMQHQHLQHQQLQQQHMEQEQHLQQQQQQHHSHQHQQHIQQHIMVPQQPVYQSMQSPRYHMYANQPSPGLRSRPQAYIPSAQYIQNATGSSSLNQMQVFGDYGEMSTYNVNPGDHSHHHHGASHYHHYQQQQGAQHQMYNPQAQVYQPQGQEYHHHHGPGQPEDQQQQLTETESIAMDIMGLFTDSGQQETTETRIENI